MYNLLLIGPTTKLKILINLIHYIILKLNNLHDSLLLKDEIKKVVAKREDLNILLIAVNKIIVNCPIYVKIYLSNKKLPEGQY